MSLITIPVDAKYVILQNSEFITETIQVDSGGRPQTRRVRREITHSVDSGWDLAMYNAAIEGANTIWRPADIQFRASEPAVFQTRPPGNITHINDDSYQFLISQTTGRPGRITLLLVRQFSRWDLGGRASRGTCIMPSTLTAHNRARVFAHEFGHLLNLPHLETEGQHLRNLMRPGLVAGPELLPDQMTTARESPLATSAVANQHREYSQ